MSKSTPMNIDEFVVLDNKMDGDEPAALVELRHRSPLYITALKPESKADKLRRINLGYNLSQKILR